MRVLCIVVSILKPAVLLLLGIKTEDTRIKLTEMSSTNSFTRPYYYSCVIQEPWVEVECKNRKTNQEHNG